MKQTCLLALAVLCLAALTVFSGPSPLQRPPAKPGGTVALPGGVRVERDIAYVTGGHARQKLDLYLPEAAGALPLIINIHGGAFRMGSKADGVPVEYLGLGYAVASIGYRLSGDAIWPAQIEDCKAAVRWLRANAAKYGLDPDRFAVWGASAGGHLAAMVGTAGGVKEFDVGENLSVSSRVQAVVDHFGPTDFLQMDAHRLPNGQVHDGADSPESQLVGGALRENKDKVARANPITYVTKEDPPFLICHGDADPLVPHHQSVLLEAALRKAGVPVTFYTVKGGGHGRFNDPKVAELTKEFLAKHLKPAPSGIDAEADEVCVLQTSLGAMTFELFPADAPRTVAQFKKLVREGFYDGKDFYRVVRGHVIQTGGGDAPKLPPEFNARPHVFGTLGLGRTGDEGSGDSEFYVCVAARPYLDGKYTVFGRLVEGAAVLERIAVVPVKEVWEGEARMAMHRPVEPVVIRKARLEARGNARAREDGSLPAIRGLVVRYFFKDTAAAERFYGRTLGLPTARPGLFRLSATTYLGIAPIAEAGADAPKTATLSFVTEEVDGWYGYLKARGLTMRSELKDATRHPTRGFVTADPEGHLLEFERFLDDPRNSRLLDALAKVEPVGPAAGAGTEGDMSGGGPARPKDLKIKANILWLYYKDVEAARWFATDSLSAGLLVDQGFAKVMTASPTGFIGLVDGAQGLHPFTERKAVRIDLLTDDPAAWGPILKRRGVAAVPEGEAVILSDAGGYLFRFSGRT